MGAAHCQGCRSQKWGQKDTDTEQDGRGQLSLLLVQVDLSHPIKNCVLMMRIHSLACPGLQAD